MIPKTKTKTTWATHTLRCDSEDVTYYGRVLETWDGKMIREISGCDHFHATREEAETCAETLLIDLK